MPLKRLLIMLILLNTACSGLLDGWRAKPAAPAQEGWNAVWIWTADSHPNQWVAFRTKFTIDSPVVSAQARIAVDTKYWLYVNGRLAVFDGGLKRGPNPQDTYFDEVDLAPYLKVGENLVAVLVWYLGKSGLSHNDSRQGGLIFDAAITSQKSRQRLASDQSWKAMAHPGYQSDQNGPQPNERLSEANIYYDASRAVTLQGWTTVSYQDAAWLPAQVRGAAGAPPWNRLQPRPIPLFVFSDLVDYVNAGSLPQQGLGDQVITATLPSNLQVTPYLQVDAPAGQVIAIQSDHYLDGGEPNLRATYVTGDGVQEFEALAWISGTAIQYRIPRQVKILALKYRESGYAARFVGQFQSGDPFLDALWTRSARTLYLNMRDNYMDCPTRERAQWWADVTGEMKGGFYVFDANASLLTQKAIGELVGWQRPDKTIDSPVPGNGRQELPAQSLSAVAALWTYYQYSGDAATVLKAYPAVKDYLSLWSIQADGRLRQRAGDWEWYDNGSDIDGDLLGTVWYFQALDSSAQLAGLAGLAGEAKEWNQKKAALSGRFEVGFWDVRSGAYRSPDYTGETDERGNALAVVAGLADASHYPQLRQVLKSGEHASPYMELYVLEALYRMGYPDDALARLHSRYKRQVNSPGYTLWESWTNWTNWSKQQQRGTDDHGWNSSPVFILSAYAAGVQPIRPGFEMFQVMPQPGPLTTIHAVIPSPPGLIEVDYQAVETGSLTLQVSAPDHTQALVAVPATGLPGTEIRVNHQKVYPPGGQSAQVQSVTYLREDDHFIYFQAGPGNWKFELTAGGR